MGANHHCLSMLKNAQHAIPLPQGELELHMKLTSCIKGET